MFVQNHPTPRCALRRACLRALATTHAPDKAYAVPRQGPYAVVLLMPCAGARPWPAQPRRADPRDPTQLLPLYHAQVPPAPCAWQHTHALQPAGASLWGEVRRGVRWALARTMDECIRPLCSPVIAVHCGDSSLLGAQQA
jgi:hypothetical protein